MNGEIGFAEAGRIPQELLPRGLQQDIAGRLPSGQLRGGRNLFRGRPAVTQSRHEQRDHNRDGRQGGYRKSPAHGRNAEPAARRECSFLGRLRCAHDSGMKPRLRLCYGDQRERGVHADTARLQCAQLLTATFATLQMILEPRVQRSRKHGFQHGVFQLPCGAYGQRANISFGFVAHLIASNKSFLAVCSRERTVPAGTPSTTATSAGSMSSTTASCSTWRSFSGSVAIDCRNCCASSRFSEFCAPSTVSACVLCQAVSRAL